LRFSINHAYTKTLVNYKGQASFAVVIQGFDLDGDGKVDAIEVNE
jgi:hypothetical protein